MVLLFHLFDLLLDIFTTIMALFRSVFDSFNHLFMSFPAFIELGLQLLVLDLFEFNLLLKDGKLLFKHVAKALKFFILIFDTGFKLIFSLTRKLSHILEFKLKFFNISPALRLEFIQSSLHFIVLTLTHGHVVLKVSLIFLPFSSLEVVFLLNLFVRRLKLKQLFSSFLKFNIKSLYLKLILRLNVSSPLLVIFLFAFKLRRVLILFLLVILDGSLQEFNFLLLQSQLFFVLAFCLVDFSLQIVGQVLCILQLLLVIFHFSESVFSRAICFLTKLSFNS